MTAPSPSQLQLATPGAFAKLIASLAAALATSYGAARATDARTGVLLAVPVVFLNIVAVVAGVEVEELEGEQPPKGVERFFSTSSPK